MKFNLSNGGRRKEGRKERKGRRNFDVVLKKTSIVEVEMEEEENWTTGDE